jgi:DNA-binding PadR family transcriptional regulator
MTLRAGSVPDGDHLTRAEATLFDIECRYSDATIHGERIADHASAARLAGALYRSVGLSVAIDGLFVRRVKLGIVRQEATDRPMARMKHQDLLKGLIRLHILHHASKAAFYGQWMIHELARHGYALSPGTLYPMLHGMERRGYLTSKTERSGRTFRRLYRATALGREANKVAKVQVRELIGELQRSRSATPEDQ